MVTNNPIFCLTAKKKYVTTSYIYFPVSIFFARENSKIVGWPFMWFYEGRSIPTAPSCKEYHIALMYWNDYCHEFEKKKKRWRRRRSICLPCDASASRNSKFMLTIKSSWKFSYTVTVSILGCFWTFSVCSIKKLGAKYLSYELVLNVLEMSFSNYLDA